MITMTALIVAIPIIAFLLGRRWYYRTYHSQTSHANMRPVRSVDPSARIVSRGTDLSPDERDSAFLDDNDPFTIQHKSISYTETVKRNAPRRATSFYEISSN